MTTPVPSHFITANAPYAVYIGLRVENEIRIVFTTHL
jgi:hypothetical protein